MGVIESVILLIDKKIRLQIYTCILKIRYNLFTCGFSVSIKVIFQVRIMFNIMSMVKVRIIIMIMAMVNCNDNLMCIDQFNLGSIGQLPSPHVIKQKIDDHNGSTD